MIEYAVLKNTQTGWGLWRLLLPSLLLTFFCLQGLQAQSADQHSSEQGSFEQQALRKQQTLEQQTLANEPRNTLVVGSKAFAEGYLLGEILAQLLESDGFQVERRLGLGKTLITYEALAHGEIDVYVEYTGTLLQAILKQPADAAKIPFDMAKLNAALQNRGLQVLPPLGFNSTYALVMSANKKQAFNIQTIGDLTQYADWVVSISHEFMHRPDGWFQLKEAYQLPQKAGGIEHSLAYEAINNGSIAITDAYSTDGDIATRGLELLEDNLGFFPEYLALPLVRQSMPDAAKASIMQLAGTIDERLMQQLNAKVLQEDQSYASVARDFLNDAGLKDGLSLNDGLSLTERLLTRLQPLIKPLKEHLQLTFSALLAATLLGVGVGLLCYRSHKLSRLLIYSTGLMQTIPSLALLALLIPIFGIGWLPAVIALFVYSLLPIVRSTLTSLVTIDPLLKEVALGLGLTHKQQILKVYLPMALPGMLTGIKTAAVISIGTATLASFIGAGGLGDPIITGLSLNDHSLVLLGAIPAALLAIMTEWLFERLERRWIPAHMRGR